MAAKEVDVNNVMSGGIFIYNINIVIIKNISIGMIVLYILFISFFHNVPLIIYMIIVFEV